MIRAILLIVCIALIGCSRAAQQSALTPRAAATILDLFATADSVVAFDIESSMTVKTAAEANQPGSPQLLGSLAMSPEPLGGLVAGYLPRSRGFRLSAAAIRTCGTLFTDPRAHVCRADLSIFSPVLALEIYRGSSRAECLMEAGCRNWRLGYGSSRFGGNLLLTKGTVRDLVREVFPADDHVRWLFEA